MNNAIRFAIFNRDDFTCQYCGRKAPEVRLEVDHIRPVSEGGKDEAKNLVTSCFECNRGKNVKILKAVKEPKEIDLPKEQIAAYPVLSIRLDPETKDWMTNESFNYRSWNLFVRELKNRYESKI